LVQKEEELAAVKKELGITPFTEFKQSMAQGWRVVGDKWKEVQETETYEMCMECECADVKSEVWNVLSGASHCVENGPET
jgi:methanogenic corrinoid protein MtbC1